MKQFLYKNIILYSSHQWCGNSFEYFRDHSEKFLVFLLMPRVQNKDNELHVYHKGKLVEKVALRMSEQFFLYYFFWYWNYLWVLWKYFDRKEKVYLIIAHPYNFFLGSIQKLFRHVEFVYWIADYFPPINKTLFRYERLKKFYHDGMRYACYLGDGVNKQMNGSVMDTKFRKTIMWGVNPKKIKRNLKKIQKTLLYVGVVRESVGLDIVYRFLKEHRDYRLKVIGICDPATFVKQKQLIDDLGVSGQVYFPNRFFFDDELTELSKSCLAGLALYTTDNTNTIYYSDPGKVKAYAEMNLPVIMSKTSSIMPYIKKFHAGEVIDRTPAALFGAVKKITGKYDTYIRGLEAFNKFFYYQDYYASGFRHLEES